MEVSDEHPFWLGVVVGASSLVLLAAWWRLKHAVDADERGHQFALLRQQILEDARWMAHDPKVAPVCERYARMAGKDWKNYAPENVSDFRRRIGCDPSYGVLGTDHQTFSLSDADESQERNEEK
jgi:hypothetical protein